MLAPRGSSCNVTLEYLSPMQAGETLVDAFWHFQLRAVCRCGVGREWEGVGPRGQLRLQMGDRGGEEPDVEVEGLSYTVGGYRVGLNVHESTLQVVSGGGGRFAVARAHTAFSLAGEGRPYANVEHAAAIANRGAALGAQRGSGGRRVRVGVFSSMDPSRWDGMKRMILAQFEDANQSEVEFVMVDTSCRAERLPGSVVEQVLRRSGAGFEAVCFRCPDEGSPSDPFCPNGDTRLLAKALHVDSEQWRSLSDIPPPLLRVFEPFFKVVSSFDAVMATLPPRSESLYTLRLAGLIPNGPRRILHLGARTTVEPRFWQRFDIPGAHLLQGVGIGLQFGQAWEEEEETERRRVLEMTGKDCLQHLGGFHQVDTCRLHSMPLAGVWRAATTLRQDEDRCRRHMEIGQGPLPRATLPADALLAPSEEVAARQEIAALHLPIHIVVTGVDTTKTFNPLRTTPLPTLLPTSSSSSSSSPPPLLFGSAARLSTEKGIGVVLEAFALLQQRLLARPRPDGRGVRLVLVGRAKHPTFEAGVRDWIRVLRISSSVHLEGFLNPDQVPRVLRSLDVLLCPYLSPFTETFGLTAVEGMAMALPVIHYGQGGMADYADSNTTILVREWGKHALADAMETLARDDHKRKELGAAARRKATTLFDASLWGKAITNLYQVH